MSSLAVGGCRFSQRVRNTLWLHEISARRSTLTCTSHFSSSSSTTNINSSSSRSTNIKRLSPGTEQNKIPQGLAYHRVGQGGRQHAAKQHELRAEGTPEDNKRVAWDELSTEIHYLFRDRDTCNRELFEHFVKHRLDICDASQITNFIRLAGRKSKSKSYLLLVENLRYVALKLEKLKSHPWSFKNISRVIYGLQCLSVKDSGYTEIIITMTDIANDNMKRNNDFPPQNLSMSLYGLQRNNCEDEPSRRLLSVLAKMTTQCIGTFNSQCVGNSLYGLQGMSSEHEEVREMLTALVPKVKNIEGSIDSQNMGSALYGLQGMSSDHAEVCAMLSALLPIVKTCNESLDVKAVVNALYGFQGMSSDSFEVREMLVALVPIIKNCNGHMNAQGVGNTLYGLQGMSGDSAEVCALLVALMPLLRNCIEPLNALAVSNAIYGLRVSLSSLESQPIVDYLLSHALILVKPPASLKLMSTNDMINLRRSIIFSLPALQACLNSDHSKWEEINTLLDNEFISRRERFPQNNGVDASRSNAEKRLRHLCAKVFEKSDIKLSSNEHLLNLFECDIVLRIPYVDGGGAVSNQSTSGGGGCLIINIEVDGAHHIRGNRKRFRHLRDGYLMLRGVVIVRLTAIALGKMKNKQVEKWLLGKVANAKLESK